MAKRHVVLGAAVAAVFVGGGAYAAIPAGDGTITSCYDTSGTLRVIDTATTTSCPGGMTKLVWNQQGRTGPTGPRGLSGSANVHWVRLAASDGHVVAKSDGWGGNWGIGRYYAGWDGVNLARCAIAVTPVRDYTATPVMTSVYATYSAYTMVEVKGIRPNSSPIAYDNVATDVYITASCV